MIKKDIQNINEYKFLKNSEGNVLFQITSDQNNKFNINITNDNENLNIKAICQKYSSENIYEKTINLKEIEEKKLFCGFQNIDQYLKEIYRGINSGKEIIIEENDAITLIIPFNSKFKEIKFKLNKINDKVLEIGDKNNENNLSKNKIYLSICIILSFLIILNLLNNKINYQKSLIIIQKNQMNNIRNNVILLENQMKSLENQIVSYNLEISSLINANKKLKENINTLFILDQRENGLSLDSTIINNYKEYSLSLKNWISSSKYISSKLLFRLSKDGKDQYHKKCDNIYPTLTLVETKEGYSFGGFTPCNLKNIGNECFEKDNGSSFLFFLNSYNKNNYYDYYDNRNYSKSYSNSTILESGYIYFYSNFDKCKFNGKYSSINNQNVNGINLNYDFNISEIEVFEIIFEDMIK